MYLFSVFSCNWYKFSSILFKCCTKLSMHKRLWINYSSWRYAPSATFSKTILNFRAFIDLDMLYFTVLAKLIVENLSTISSKRHSQGWIRYNLSLSPSIIHPLPTCDHPRNKIVRRGKKWMWMLASDSSWMVMAGDVPGWNATFHHRCRLRLLPPTFGLVWAVSGRTSFDTFFRPN